MIIAGDNEEITILISRLLLRMFGTSFGLPLTINGMQRKQPDNGRFDHGRDPFNQNFLKFWSKTQWIGSVQLEKFKKTGPPSEVDHFSRSDRSEFWLNGLRPIYHVKLSQSTALEQKRFDIRSLSPALRNLWLLLVWL